MKLVRVKKRSLILKIIKKIMFSYLITKLKIKNNNNNSNKFLNSLKNNLALIDLIYKSIPMNI